MILVLTYRCNKKCEYCYASFKEYNSIERELTPELLEDLKFMFNNLNKSENIIITGGEPGILNTDYLDEIFKIIPGQIVTMFTNTLFIKKGYNKRYDNKIMNYVIHLTGDDPLPRIEKHHEFIYVVTKNNIDTLPIISKKYSNVQINIKLYEQSKSDDPLVLDETDLAKLEMVCNDHHNLNFKITNRRKVEINNLNSIIELCRQYPLCNEIDLPNDDINYCCNAEDKPIKIGISKSNYIKVNNRSLSSFDLGLTNCENCGLIRNQGNDMLLQLIKLKIKRN